MSSILNFTKKASFYLDASNKIEVHMMYSKNKKAKFLYAVLTELDAQAVALPYKVNFRNYLCL